MDSSTVGTPLAPPSISPTLHPTVLFVPGTNASILPGMRARMTFPRFLKFAAAFVLMVAGNAQASLHDRGRGLIYDDVLNITWTQNANLSASLPLGVEMRSDGAMTFVQAQAWIAALNAVRFGGYDDWRLPGGSPLNGNDFLVGITMFGSRTLYADGSHDDGYNISAPESVYPGSVAHELPYMHFNNLGNGAYFDVNYHRELALCPDDPPQCLQHTGPFDNLQLGAYRTSIPWPGTSISDGAVFGFVFSEGAQGAVADPYMFVWPVRDGDVALVTAESAKSIPAFGWLGLFGMALGLIVIGVRRLYTN